MLQKSNEAPRADNSHASRDDNSHASRDDNSQASRADDNQALRAKLEVSKEFILDLIEYYDLHAVTLCKVSDYASKEQRRYRKVPNYEGYKEFKNRKSAEECREWIEQGGGIALIGGYLAKAWYGYGFPILNLMSEEEEKLYFRQNRKYLNILDIDNCGLDALSEVCTGMVEQAPYVSRTDNPFKGKFVFFTEDPIDTRKFSLATKNHPNEMMFELTSQGVVFGKHPDGGHYIWHNIPYTLPEGLSDTWYSSPNPKLPTLDDRGVEEVCNRLENLKDVEVCN